MRSIRRRARWFQDAHQAFQDAYQALVTAVHGGDQSVSADPALPGERATAEERAHVLNARSQLFDALGRGQSLESAAVCAVRAMIEVGQLSASASFADALAAQEGTTTAGHLASAVVASHRKLPDLARAEFDAVPKSLWRKHALAEYLDSRYRCDRNQAAAEIRELVDAEDSDELGAQAWFETIRYAFVLGDFDRARRAYRNLVRAAGREGESWPAARNEIEWLRPWLAAEDDERAHVRQPGGVGFALIDYRQPGKAKTSQNIGDHIQTLASLGHLVRHHNLRLHGDGDITEFAAEMQRQVRPDRRLDTPAADVTLYRAERDSSNCQDFPVNTWSFVFGWYMHPLFGLRHDFPLHPNLRPIFVSFHCNKREMLTGEAIEYLRRYGPVGCRDWTTVDLLLSIDVPAFFSGCITTTVDTVFTELDPAERPHGERTAYVDMPSGSVPAGAATFRHSYGKVKRRSFAGNLREAHSLLENYRADYTTVATSRLHCYLPVRSLGVDVDFQPKNRADVRFSGLIDIDDTAFDAIRTGILDRLGEVTTAILAGKPVDEVYDLWRALCADDVAAARARRAKPAGLPGPTSAELNAAGKVRDAAVVTGPEVADHAVDVVVPVQAGDITRLPKTVRSILAHSSKPMRLWLLAKGCDESHRRRLAEALPEVRVSWLSRESLPREAWPLLLGDLLAETDQVVVVPPAAAVACDIAELAGHDLEGARLAARTSPGPAPSGFAELYRAAKRLDPDAAKAHEFYRLIHARHAFDFDAFDTEVLVADLTRMRKDSVGAEFLPYLRTFGLRPMEAFKLYVGADRAVLPAEWAHIPTKERLPNPRLVHWPGPAKPWHELYVPFSEWWNQA